MYEVLLTEIESVRKSFLEEEQQHTKKIDKEKVENFKAIIKAIEFQLDFLWAKTHDELGDFYKYFPDRCLEMLNSMKSILEMEMKDEQE